jgi:hypothetical protein
MQYKIYGVKRNSTNEVVYIGLTKNSLSKRMQGHLKDYRRNPKKSNYFLKYKTDLSIFCIEDCIEDLETANQKEVFYISEYLSKGCNLLNATIGGDGTKGVQSWNKNIPCAYIEKIINNSPKSKKIYSYDLQGNFLKEYRSIKFAAIETKCSRSQVKNIADQKVGYKQAKGFVFRYFKSDKIDQIVYEDKKRLEKVNQSKILKMKKVVCFNFLTNQKTIYKNILIAVKETGVPYPTISASISKDRVTNKKLKFEYEKN